MSLSEYRDGGCDFIDILNVTDGPQLTGQSWLNSTLTAHWLHFSSSTRAIEQGSDRVAGQRMIHFFPAKQQQISQIKNVEWPSWQLVMLVKGLGSQAC